MSRSNLEAFKKIVETGCAPQGDFRFNFPAPIARTLGIKLVAVGEATASMELTSNVLTHANPLGTIHGGVLCDIADLAIGTAHATTIAEGESFTSVDLQINFFRPIWNEVIRADVKPIHRGRSMSRYVCDVFKADGKLVAQVTSTVMTLRDEKAAGR